MSKELTKEDIAKLAHLARLELSDKEKDVYARELSSILSYIEILEDVNVDGYKPTTQVTGLSNVFRKDEVKSYGYDVESLMNNVPNKKDGYIQVKRMIG